MQKDIFHTAKGHLLQGKSIATERHAPPPCRHAARKQNGTIVLQGVRMLTDCKMQDAK